MDLGLYYRAGEWDRARGAYLADWLAGGDDATFPAWVTTAIHRYAQLTPDQRRAVPPPPTETADRAGISRMLRLPDDAVEIVDQARRADQTVHLIRPRSRWITDAITAAADAAQARDGTLPTPPARLPNRLVR